MVECVKRKIMELDTSVFFRTEVETKKILRAEAKARHLKLSDIVREAVDEFVGSHNLKVKHAGQLPNG